MAKNELFPMLQEKERATEGMASQAALLEESKKNVEDANGRCQALQEALDEARAALRAVRQEAAVQAADGGERLSTAERELESLRQQVRLREIRHSYP